MELVHIVAHGNEEDFGFDFLASPQEELAKTVILLDNTKGTFDLYRAIHAQENAHLRPVHKQVLIDSDRPLYPTHSSV